MNLIQYDFRFRIEWKNGGTSIGSWDYFTEDLKEIFDDLYKEVLIESLKDPVEDEITEPPENISRIHITIHNLEDFG